MLKQMQVARTVPAFVVLLLSSTLASAQQSQCKLGDLPDQSPECTPGLVAATDQADVCSRVGGTYSQRHRLSQNPQTKKEVLSRYDVPMSDAHLYEDDHDLPLCLGGSDSIQNRWPELLQGKWNAHIKDKLEAEACREVCDNEVSLAEAQSWFLTPANWEASYCHVFPSDSLCK
jgi:hypothetical protein